MRQMKSGGMSGALLRRQMFVSGWGSIVVMSSLLLVACDSGSKETAVAPPPGVLVAKVARRQISETIEYVGQTVAVNDVSLRAQVAGYLLERKFQEGQNVEQNAELFLIDPALYEAGVAAADGAVAEANAAVARADKDAKRYRTLFSPVLSLKVM